MALDMYTYLQYRTRLLQKGLRPRTAAHCAPAGPGVWHEPGCAARGEGDGQAAEESLQDYGLPRRLAAGNQWNTARLPAVRGVHQHADHGMEEIDRLVEHGMRS